MIQNGDHKKKHVQIENRRVLVKMTIFDHFGPYLGPLYITYN